MTDDVHEPTKAPPDDIGAHLPDVQDDEVPEPSGEPGGQQQQEDEPHAP